MADAGIILAAGTASRMGCTKQLLPWQGRPLLAHVLDTCLHSPLSPLVLVLGHDKERILAELARSGSDLKKVIVVVNPDFQTGMASSLRAGVEALSALSKALQGALFILGDQPLVSPDTISAILETAHTRPGRIIIPRSRGRRGNPVYFPSAFFTHLAGLSGDCGGRALFEQFPDQLAYLDLPSRQIHTDLDTPEDYSRLLAIDAPGGQLKPAPKPCSRTLVIRHI